MGIFGSNGHAARIEERLNTILKGHERHASEFTRRMDHHTNDIKALETGIRADLQGMAGTLTRIEGLLKARNGNGAARAAGAVVKKQALPVGGGIGLGGVVVALLQHFGLI